MRVSKERIDRYLRKLDGLVCPLCKQSDWKVTNQLFQLDAFNDLNFLARNESSVPFLLITCGECGNTYLINALVSGLISKAYTTNSFDTPSIVLIGKDESKRVINLAQPSQKLLTRRQHSKKKELSDILIE